MPAAGLSTRFPNMRPKYTLTDFSGKMMFEKAIEPYLGQYQITIGILDQHEKIYSIRNHIKSRYKDVDIVILPNLTTGPADTVYQILKYKNFKQEEILIKDCDSFFKHTYQEGNYVCYSSIKDHEILKRLGNKSYIISNNQGIITKIVEKEIVSDKFCVGGYKFEQAQTFIEIFEQLFAYSKQEVYVSHIIEEMLNLGHVFKECAIENYVDVGTAEDWFLYNDKAVIFCDIDGTIVCAQKKEDYDKKPKPLFSNIDRIKSLAKNGKIIFTTARPSEYDEITRVMLKNLGFEDFDLVSGLPNTKRILINDYNEANPYPRAIAVNIKRDSDNVKDFI